MKVVLLRKPAAEQKDEFLNEQSKTADEGSSLDQKIKFETQTGSFISEDDLDYNCFAN